MRLGHVIAGIAAMSISTAPITAQAASSNPAAMLSIGKTMRVGAPAANASKLEGELFGGAGIIAGLIVAGIIAIVVVGATNDDSDSP